MSDGAGTAAATPVEGQAATSAGRTARPRATTGLYFFGVMRTPTWRSDAGQDGSGVVRLRYRELEALAKPAAWETPELDDASVHAHQRVLEAALRKGTVLPAPFGIVFRSRRHLMRMLEDQYTALDEGLTFLEGHWELRVHLTPASGQPADSSFGDLAMQLYSELRRGVRAAVPFPRDEHRLLSAAFLVERGTWLEFMQRADDLNAQHPEVSFDITGPWPAYDFVRIRS